jgi:hypothetical protein
MKTEGGDCYEAAGNYMTEKCMFSRGDCHLILVHAEVIGQGPIDGLKYGHAFVLDGDTVIDNSNGRNLKMPKQVYYNVGGIGANVHEYSFEDFRQKIMEYKHWGPWDLETESGY